MRKTAALALAAAAVAGAFAQPAVAAEPWMIRVRALYLDPADKSQAIPALAVPTDAITVRDKWFPEVDISYFLTPNIAAELVLTYPQKHDVTVQQSALGGPVQIGSFKHLPRPLVPAQPGKYFIFANSANFPAGGAITVSVVDMNLFGNAPFPTPPIGDVESKNTAIPGLINRAEGMIIIPDANGIDFYLETQQINSQSFSVTTINAASYTGTFTTSTFSGIAVPTSAANLSYHAGTGRIAVSPQDTSTDAIHPQFQ